MSRSARSFGSSFESFGSPCPGAASSNTCSSSPPPAGSSSSVGMRVMASSRFGFQICDLRMGSLIAIANPKSQIQNLASSMEHVLQLVEKALALRQRIGAFGRGEFPQQLLLFLRQLLRDLHQH